MKKKPFMKNYLPKTLTAVLVLFLTSCQVDEEVVKTESVIQTVKIDEAKSFLRQSQPKSNARVLNSNEFEFDKITQEELINTDQLLTVVPISKTDSRRFDRILLLKVNNEIKSVVFKMYSDEPKIATKFSGKILIYDLEGNFINGFGVKKGVFVLQYIKSKSSSKKSNVKISGDGDWDLGELKEIIIPSRKKNQPEIADFGWGDNLSGGSGFDNYSWMYDSGGSSSSSGNGDNLVDKYEDPCDNLKKQTTDVNFKKNISFLEANTGLKNETGYAQKKDGSFYPLQNGSDGDSMKFPIHSDDVGYMHTHLKPYESSEFDPDGNPLIKSPIQMFSPGDVQQFILLLMNAGKNNIPLIDIYGTMVSDSGTYMLKYVGVYNGINTGLNFDNALNESYKKYFRTYTNKEKAFLLFMKEKIGIDIELYKLKDDGTIEKKVLNSAKKVDTNPCQ